MVPLTYSIAHLSDFVFPKQTILKISRLKECVIVHTNRYKGVMQMKKLRRLLFLLILSCLTIVLGIYIYAYFDELPLHDARESITIYDKHGDILYETNFKKNMEWTSIEDIPIFVQKAFVSVEDKRFYHHPGVDPIRLVKALGNNLLSGGIVEGGSTITQQYAKNLFLTNEQTIARKIQEFFYAARLEMQYSKEEILEGYLNTAYFGHGIYGIKAAGQYFFDKDLKDLDIAETAMLIGIPNGPSIYSPFLHYDRAKQRQELILQILNHNDVISDSQYASAKDEELRLATNDEVKKVSGNDEYFIDAVIQELQNDTRINTEQELHVYTSYDPAVQNALQSAIEQSMGNQAELECAGVVIEPFTGHVLAIAGGKDYTASQYNRALHSQRQVASTIKPLLYYTALSQGFTPATTFSSQPTTFQVGNEEYEPHNYNDKYPYREISMINAIAMSDNIYAVKTHLFLGTATLHNALLDFGITQSQENPSEALGTVNMSVLELGRIYNTFASEGLYTKPTFIQKITDRKQDVLFEQSQQPKRLLDRDITLVLNQTLTATYDTNNQTTSYPTMAGYAPKPKVGVKSGTSNWDAWTVGFNPQYTLAIWTGFDDNRDLEKEYYDLDKAIFKNTFNTLYEEQTGPWYQISDAIEVRYVDPISGKSASSGSPYWFLKEK